MSEPATRTSATPDPGSAGAATPDASAPDAIGTGQVDAAPPPPPALDAGAPTPILLAAQNYVAMRSDLLPYRPYIAYGWAADPALQGYDQELARLASIQDANVEKWIMFSSWRTLQSKIATAAAVSDLRQRGVVAFGYNSEGDKTPADEMAALDSTDPSTNSVALFSAIAHAQGFRAIWGPIRETADAVSDGAITAMMAAGLDGIGLQEQQPIESSCVPARDAAVQATATRYRGLAGARPFHVDVQVMPTRCQSGDAYGAANCGESGATYGHCAAFAHDIASIVDSIGIWASSPDDLSGLPPLVRALRQ